MFDRNPMLPDRKTAGRRLLITLAVVLGFVIYSYGWTVTDIDLEKPQEELRQENTGNALRELLSPNIFDQDRILQEVTAYFRVGCIDDETIEQPENDEGTIEISTDCGEPGDTVRFTVTGLDSRVDARARWIPPGEDVQIRPREILETGREEFVLDRNGAFTGTIEVPRIRGGEGEIHTISVRAAIPVGPVKPSDTSIQVFRRMLETIFMALVATSIAIPIAALISFFAARNLMQPIKLSTGSLLVAFIGLAVGILVGGRLWGQVAAWGVKIGRGNEDGAWLAFIVPALVLVGTGGFFRIFGNVRVDPEHARDPINILRSIFTRIVIMTAIIFLIGALGGLGLLGGDQINTLADNVLPERLEGTDILTVIVDVIEDSEAPDIQNDNLFETLDESVVLLIVGGIAAVGNLFSVLGGLVELFVTPLGAVTGGFVLSGIATSILSTPLRLVPVEVSHVVGSVLGAISGAILFYVLGLIGTWAALLGLLSPIAAALLGGSGLVMIYRLFNPRDMRTRQYEPDLADDIVRWSIFAIGAVIAFIITSLFLNLRIALVNQTLPSENTIEFLGFTMRGYIRDNILIGLILGGLAGALSGVKAAFALGTTMYNISRTILNTIRSIEPLIMGLVFVVWVGIGPFAGVLALTLHSIAALGKLYSEQVENIDDGPVEALDSTGANRLQTIIYAVVPQIVPPYIAFTMYRWDINVRMSTIIGFVGGGGIGLLLQQQINLLRYSEAGVAVLAIAVVVSILDYLSAYIRERIM